MSGLESQIKEEIKNLQKKLDDQNDLTKSDLEILLLSALIEEEAK